MFDAVTVVDVDVNVKDSRMMKEQLKNSEYNVVDVAESRSFSLFGMMQPSRPVDSDVRLMVCELAGCVKRSSGIKRAVVVEAVEDGAVVTSIVSICLAVGIPCVV